MKDKVIIHYKNYILHDTEIGKDFLEFQKWCNENGYEVQAGQMNDGKWKWFAMPVEKEEPSSNEKSWF